MVMLRRNSRDSFAPGSSGNNVLSGGGVFGVAI